MERTKRKGATVEQQLNREGHWPPPNLLLHHKGFERKSFLFVPRLLWVLLSMGLDLFFRCSPWKLESVAVGGWLLELKSATPWWMSNL